MPAATGNLHVSFFRFHIKILIQTAAEHSLCINLQNFRFRRNVLLTFHIDTYYHLQRYKNPTISYCFHITYYVCLLSGTGDPPSVHINVTMPAFVGGDKNARSSGRAYKGAISANYDDRHQYTLLDSSLIQRTACALPASNTPS